MKSDCNGLLEIEKKLRENGYKLIAGIDEAGRGPLAGPVVSACVIFDEKTYIDQVNDSKLLSPKLRENLYNIIINKALYFSISIIDNYVIDEVNILEATKLSMIDCVKKLKVKPDFILIDAIQLPIDIPHQGIIKGDRKSFSIAAASILAKVTRDRIMLDYHKEYPYYFWDKNKGYPTLQHKLAIKKYGLSPYHRKSFNYEVL